MIVDISGFFVSKTVFVPLATPVRLSDSRQGGTTVDGSYAGGGPTSPGYNRSVPVAGRAGIPARAASHTDRPRGRHVWDTRLTDGWRSRDRRWCHAQVRIAHPRTICARRHRPRPPGKCGRTVSRAHGNVSTLARRPKPPVCEIRTRPRNGGIRAWRDSDRSVRSWRLLRKRAPTRLDAWGQPSCCQRACSL